MADIRTNERKTGTEIPKTNLKKRNILKTNKLKYLSDFELLNIICKKQRKSFCKHCPFEYCVASIGLFNKAEAKRITEIINKYREDLPGTKNAKS